MRSVAAIDGSIYLSIQTDDDFLEPSAAVRRIEVGGASSAAAVVASHVELSDEDGDDSFEDLALAPSHRLLFAACNLAVSSAEAEFMGLVKEYRATFSEAT